MRTPRFLGVYSEKNSGNSAVISGKIFYFVWKLENSSHVMQKLDKSLVPHGPLRLVTQADLAERYQFEPSILAAPISTPDFRQVRQKPEAGKGTELTDQSLQELEKARKTKQVEVDLRNNFDKAMRALNRPRDRKGALAALAQLAATTNGIVPAHKHMFRDFGVSLRKKSLPDLALQYAKRAVELAPDDDHAHFNVARLLGILGMYEEASAHLRKAIELDRSEPVYRKLQAHLDRESGE